MTGIQFATTAGPLYTETRSYNNLLQLTNITAAGSGLPGMNLTYAYSTGHNNGQAAAITDALSGEQITYTYDLLNRLIQAQTTQNHTQYPNAPWWGQAYTYDGFGNLMTKTPVGPGNSTVMSLSVDPNTNHFTASGYGYDANGNVTTLPQSSGNLALSYDVENRFQTSGGVLMFDMEGEPLYDSGAGKYSIWDLNGRRLRHESITIGVNPPAGQAIPNYTITDRNIYFGDRLIQSNSKTVLVDRLGSVRANESGERFEYLPYGEEFNLTSQNREKFATYTRSSANGLDYAINRWYDSVHGSFITPDPHTLSMDLSNPGTMNRYAYVGGDPVNSADPQGLDYVCVNGMLTASFESCMPDLAEPGFGANGLGNIPCGDGSMISAFASPAEIANCQAPGLGPEGPTQPIAAVPHCFDGSLDDNTFMATGVTMGENSWYLLGHASYTPTDSWGRPTGPTITAASVFTEDQYFASVLVNRSIASGTSVSAVIGQHPGQFATVSGIASLVAAEYSAPGSSPCNDLTEALNAVNGVFSNGSVLPARYQFWKSIDQGTTFHQYQPEDIYINNTAFGTVNTTSGPRRRLRPL